MRPVGAFTKWRGAEAEVHGSSMVLHNQTFEKTARHAAAPSFDPPLMMTRDRVNRHESLLLNRAHYHADFFALYLVREGAGTHIIDDVPYSISRGDVYVMRPGSRHLYTQCRDLVLEGLYFRPDIFDETTRNDLVTVPAFGALFIEEPIRRYADAAAAGRSVADAAPPSGRWMRLSHAQYEGVTAEVAELQTAWEEDVAAFGRASLIRALLTRLIIHLARHYGRTGDMPEAGADGGTPRPATSAQRIREATVMVAIKHMREHLAEEIRIEQISASVFLSPDHFGKVFAAAVGQSPSEYLRGLRVGEAKRLLATTRDSITDIATAVGFNQAAYFTRVFRGATGMTPRDFRRNAASPEA